MARYIPGVGNPSPWLMIIGEAPGAEEDQQGEPFVGAAGKLTREMVERAGEDWGRTYRTNVRKYRPPNNNLKRIHEIPEANEEKEIAQLWDEIYQRKPNNILALGDLSLQTLCHKNGIGKWRGSILMTHRGLPKVVPALHTANFLYQPGIGRKYDYRDRVYTQLDFNRAIEESRTKDYTLPQYKIEFAKTPFDVYRFIKYHRDQGKDTVSVDIESSEACIPTMIALAFDSYHAMSIPLTKLPNWPVTDSDQVKIWKILDKLLGNPNIKIIGQNFKYDQDKLESIMCIRCANFYCDTVFLAHLIHAELPKALEFLTSIYTRQPYYKDEGRLFDYKKDHITKLMKYNALDVLVTFKIYEEMMPDYLELYHTREFLDYYIEMHHLYLELEREGFCLDHDKQLELFKKYDKLDEENDQRIIELAGTWFNVNSPKAVPEILTEVFRFPRRAHYDEDSLVALQQNHAKTEEQYQIIDCILNSRRYKKTKGTYVFAVPDYDGRIRTVVNQCGTKSGRSSTSKLRPPIRPKLKGFKGEQKKYNPGLAFQTLTKHGDIGVDIGEMLVPLPGYILGDADLGQAEAREVALLAEDYPLLDAMESGKDIHLDTAIEILGTPKTATKKSHPNDRFVAKSLQHGGSYDMHKRRLMTYINTESKKFGLDIRISEWRAGEDLERFHAIRPNLRGVYHPIVRDQITRTSTLINPFGRVRQFFGEKEAETFREAYSFIPQSTTKDHLSKAMIRIKYRTRKECSEQIKFIVEAHDGFTFMCKIEEFYEYARIIKEEMEVPIDFSNCSFPRSRKLILPCEIKIGKNFTAMEDYEWPKAS